MPFCPKCKNEYREGFTHCAECKCELVDSLEDLQEESPDVSTNVQGDFSGTEETAWGDSFEEEIFTDDTAAGEELPERTESPKDGYKSGIYRNSAERAEDNKSSAWTLLSVGLLGIVILVLIMTGVIPLYFYGITKYLVFGVMFAMFVLFIVMGAVSLRNSKIFAKKAESESTLSDTMKEWCAANLRAEELDASIFGEEKGQSLPSELKYFKRNAELKRLLSDKFMNLDEGFLEDFVDHIYEEVFED